MMQATMARQGFTLLEMILVLALIGAVGGLILPMVRSSWDYQLVRSTAEQMEVDLARVRLRAVQSGTPYVVEMAAQAESIRGTPYTGDLANAGIGAGGDTRFATANFPAGVAATGLLPEVVFQGLPEGITLRDIQVRSSLGYIGPSDGQVAGSIWFYPDGTASDATIVLANERNEAFPIELRGMTGSTQLGELTMVAEESR